MNNRRNERSGANGRLPACAPLANPYVPFQHEDPPMYEARHGIIRGTMYPGLDLPFMGLVNKKQLNNTPKTELQTLAFAIQELALYLDTHRDDKEAQEAFQKYNKLYGEGVAEYERRYGPLQMTASDGSDWVCDPWPWDLPVRRPEPRTYNHREG